MISWIKRTGFPLIIYAFLYSSDRVGWIDVNFWVIALISVLGGAVLQALVFGLFDKSNTDNSDCS